MFMGSRGVQSRLHSWCGLQSELQDQGSESVDTSTGLGLQRKELPGILKRLWFLEENSWLSYGIPSWPMAWKRCVRVGSSRLLCDEKTLIWNSHCWACLGICRSLEEKHDSVIYTLPHTMCNFYLLQKQSTVVDIIAFVLSQQTLG